MSQFGTKGVSLHDAAMPSHGSRKSIYSPDYERIVALLREVREQAGLTQAELAARLQRQRTFVTKIELGERRIDLLEWLQFCDACKIVPSKFLARLEQD